MIGAIKRLPQIEHAHVDCGTIRNVGFCQLSYGINSIPVGQMFLKAALVIRCLKKLENLSRTAVLKSLEITGLIEIP